MQGEKFIIKNLKEQYKNNVFINDKDGMLYCKKCLKKKTTLLAGFGNIPDKIVNCRCDCDKMAEIAEKKRISAIESEKKFRDLQTASLLDLKYINSSFESIDLNRDKSFVVAFNRCKKYCDNANEVLKNGYGIYLSGGIGTGKTLLMACMVNELTKKHYACLFTNFFEIAKQIKSTFKKSLYNESEFINKIANVPFLFIDDLGTERVQKEGEDTWLQEKIYEVINARYNAGKPTNFSSNLTIKELITKQGISPKTIDRINEMSSAVLEIKDTSYRLKNKPKEEDLPF